MNAPTDSIYSCSSSTAGTSFAMNNPGGKGNPVITNNPGEKIASLTAENTGEKKLL
jgi:hypothetical protein